MRDAGGYDSVAAAKLPPGHCSMWDDWSDAVRCAATNVAPDISRGSGARADAGASKL